LVGVRADGRKELVAVGDGYRESIESWSEVLRDLNAARDLQVVPPVASQQHNTRAQRQLYTRAPSAPALRVPAHSTRLSEVSV
jgi:hypothetical protein